MGGHCIESLDGVAWNRNLPTQHVANPVIPEVPKRSMISGSWIGAQVLTASSLMKMARRCNGQVIVDSSTHESGRFVPYHKQLQGKPSVTRPTAHSFYCSPVAVEVRLLGEKVASATTTVRLDVYSAWRIPMNLS